MYWEGKIYIIFKSSCIMWTQNMQKKHLERLQGAPGSILIILLMHQFWVQFCFGWDLNHQYGNAMPSLKFQLWITFHILHIEISCSSTLSMSLWSEAKISSFHIHKPIYFLFRKYDLQYGFVGKKGFSRCWYFWSIRCSRCKPCQVVLGEGGIKHILGKRG